MEHLPSSPLQLSSYKRSKNIYIQGKNIPAKNGHVFKCTGATSFDTAAIFSRCLAGPPTNRSAWLPAGVRLHYLGFFYLHFLVLVCFLLPLAFTFESITDLGVFFRQRVQKNTQTLPWCYVCTKVRIYGLNLSSKLVKNCPLSTDSLTRKHSKSEKLRHLLHVRR